MYLSRVCWYQLPLVFDHVLGTRSNKRTKLVVFQQTQLTHQVVLGTDETRDAQLVIASDGSLQYLLRKARLPHIALCILFFRVFLLCYFGIAPKEWQLESLEQKTGKQNI